MNKAMTVCVAAVVALACGAVHAQQARALAGTCANCHGTDGRASADAAVPGLAGMPRAYIVEQLNAFRTGARPATIMHQIARGFTREQSDQLADYYSVQPR